MRRIALLSASCLVLGGPDARAETYQILEGSLSWSQIGRNRALSGAFDVSTAPADASQDLLPLRVDDFAMQAGDRSFTPRQPIEFDGMTPILFLEIANQIHLEGDEVGLLRLRSGGEIVAASDEEVTFRFLDFRSGPSGGGHAVGRLADGVLPRRLHLEGTLYEVDQTFRIQRDPCIVRPDLPTPPGSGGIVIGAGGDVTLVHPAGAEPSPSGASATPTLEELGITAPDGAVVSYDALTGELTVTGEGDLLVEGTAIDLPGLTSVTIETPGSITITGTLTLPPGVALRLDAGGSVTVEGPIEVPGGVVVNPPYVVPIACTGLRPIFGGPDERPVGVFSLVASAARQIGIDVARGRGPDLLPGLRKWIEVAILGSDALDIRDVDERSLRLGPGEAEPTSGRGRPATRRGYANRDRHVDLLARFDLRDAGIAYGDDELCLVAETTDGEVLEGCHAIRALPHGPPARARPSHAAAPHDGATSTPDSRRSTATPQDVQGP